MSGSIADSEYSRVIEEIFQRTESLGIRATGDTVGNRALFLEWIDIFQRPGHVVASKSFKALAEMKKESVTSQGETGKEMFLEGDGYSYTDNQNLRSVLRQAVQSSRLARNIRSPCRIQN
ncbi:hypothetical protein L3Y34_002783 [Caenorhabditis briggsae]|uniref:Uncharacterized protein n=1 Tax=Caenorhabditis briggsae TaxID=6238 RepID=A0AAE9DFP9_CAEBR|nr:hypothetical protein L3Y34_002783 [Caenorhabditis briggsae]